MKEGSEGREVEGGKKNKWDVCMYVYMYVYMYVCMYVGRYMVTLCMDKFRVPKKIHPKNSIMCERKRERKKEEKKKKRDNTLHNTSKEHYLGIRGTLSPQHNFLLLFFTSLPR